MQAGGFVESGRAVGGFWLIPDSRCLATKNVYHCFCCQASGIGNQESGFNPSTVLTD